MRELALHEYRHVTGTGTEVLSLTAPAGVTITSRQEANHSTTITFTSRYGSTSWNSGVFVACYTAGAGVGMTVTLISANPVAGVLAGLATGYGCKALASTVDDDGD